VPAPSKKIPYLLIEPSLLSDYSDSLSLRGSEDLENAKIRMKIISKISYNIYALRVNETFLADSDYGEFELKLIINTRKGSETLFENTEKLNRLYSKYIPIVKNGKKDKETLAIIKLIHDEVWDLTYREYGSSYLSGIDIGEIAAVYVGFLSYSLEERNFKNYDLERKHLLMPLLTRTSKWKPKYVDLSVSKGLEYLQKTHGEDSPNKKTFLNESGLIVDSFKALETFTTQ